MRNVKKTKRGVRVASSKSQRKLVHVPKTRQQEHLPESKHMHVPNTNWYIYCDLGQRQHHGGVILTGPPGLHRSWKQLHAIRLPNAMKIEH